MASSASARHSDRFSRTKEHRIVFLVVLLVLTRLADITSTWLVTPALSHEANPVVAYLGMGWSDFLRWQAAFVLLAIMSIRYTIFIENKLLLKKPGLGLLSYVSRAFYGREWRWSNLLFAMPRDRQTALYLLNYAFSRGLILTGLFAATWNASLHYVLRGDELDAGALVHVFYPLSLLPLPDSIVQVVSLPLLLAVLFSFVYAAYRPYWRYREATNCWERPAPALATVRY
jgi:hypothetical protein